MKIVLYGASGMIGQRILREAVRRGHSVAAVTRDPASIADRGPQVHPVQGNILDAASVAATVAGHDAVVSAFAPRGDQGLDSLSTAVRSLLCGQVAARVPRLVFVGGAGSLEVAPGVELVTVPQFPEAWRGIALAHGEALRVLRTEGGDLDWAYFSPPALIEPGERTGVFRLGSDQLVSDAAGTSRISAEDYAVALVDELEKPAHHRQRFTIGY